MEWTDQSPEVNGFYWAWDGHNDAEIVYVYEGTVNTVQNLPPYNFEDYDAKEWYGPLELPE